MRGGAMLVFNNFRLDVRNACLQRGKQTIVLTPKALNVLRYLAEHAGQLITKDDLWRAVWPGISVTDATLTVCLSEIRRALGDQPKAPRYIETVSRLRSPLASTEHKVETFVARCMPINALGFEPMARLVHVG